MKHFLLILLLSSGVCYGQDTTDYQNKWDSSKFIHIKDNADTIYLKSDTTPCFLQYRLPSGQSGIVKGWEVVKVDTVERGSWYEPKGMTIYDAELMALLDYTHICYLRSDRRRFPKGTLIWKLQEPVKIK